MILCPVLVMHGKADQTIPIQHSYQLFAAAPEPKFHLWDEYSGHNDLSLVAGDRYKQAIQDFQQFLS